MLGLPFDVTMDYDHGPTPFVTPCFRDFVSCLLPFFPIFESVNPSRPNLRSTFSSHPTIEIKLWFRTSRVLSSLTSILPNFRINEVMTSHHMSSWIQRSRITLPFALCEVWIFLLAILPKSESSNSRVYFHPSTWTMNGFMVFGTSSSPWLLCTLGALFPFET